MVYRIYPKYLDTLTPYHTCPKIWKKKKSSLLPVYVSKIVLDEWQTLLTLIRCHILLPLIWVYNVCKGLSVPILRVITVALLIPCYTCRRSLGKMEYQVNIFLISQWKRMLLVCCWYSLEVPQWGTSNEYHNICFCGEIRKISILYGWCALSMALLVCNERNLLAIKECIQIIVF